MQQGSEAVDLKQVLAFLRRRALLIGLCTVVAAGAAYGLSKRERKQYTATASLAFSYDSLAQQIAGLSAVSGSSLAAQQSSNLELVRLGDMASKTASSLGHGLTGEKVAAAVSVKSSEESNVVHVAASASSPRLAAAIANTYTQQFVKEQQNANRQYFKSALALVHKQLAALPPKQRLSAAGIELQTRAQTLALLSELNYGNVQVAQEALVPSSASSPRTSRNTAFGLLLGLLLGLGLAALLERLDRRIGRPEELEAVYRLPLLGAVPKSAALAAGADSGTGKPAALPESEAEAFSLIRAHLRFFNVDRELRTLVIASAAAGDGKTVIARHLGEAAARLGARVLLLEVDLRQPTLGRQLGLQPGPGLVDVLIENCSLGDAVRRVTLEPTPGEGASGRTLDVLPAGAVLAPNPAELLESHAMYSLLEQTRSMYDLVVIDTPPLTVVSDAFPLLTKVDGVAIVGWIGRSRRDAAERLHRVFVNSGVPLLGVIANGSTEPGAYGSSNYGRPSAPLASTNGAVRSEQLV